jgi:outer membrane lipoprotein carrier protein
MTKTAMHFRIHPGLTRSHHWPHRIRGWISRGIFCSLLFAIHESQALRAQDVEQSARSVDDHYNHLRTLQADFTEIYRGNGLNREESGTLWLKKPRKMRWEYRSPKEKLFLSDGKAVWFYVPAERQIRKSDLRRLDDLRSPLAFLLGKTKLANELQGLSKVVDERPAIPGNIVLRGVPKAMRRRSLRCGWRSRRNRRLSESC